MPKTSGGNSGIGLAYSSDEIQFTKKASPIFYRDQDAHKKKEWNYRKTDGEPYLLECKYSCFDGVEDTRIVINEKGTYFMTDTVMMAKPLF